MATLRTTRLVPFRSAIRSLHRPSHCLDRTKRFVSNVEPSSPFPVIQKCPDCDDEDVPPQPDGLQIDHDRPLANTAPNHQQHVVVFTGKSDWEPRIENEPGYESIAKYLKEELGPKGRYHDPDISTLISYCSLKSPQTDPDSSHLLLFPHFQQVRIPENSRYSFIQRYLRPSAPHSNLLNAPPSSSFFAQQPVSTPTILICSHASRDTRCGILGPLLAAEFVRQISLADPGSSVSTSRVAQISHIGGHAFAGNVIVYMPPAHTQERNLQEGDNPAGSPLNGAGVWYGRVEPRHVAGILRETVGNGKVIRELWRGGMAMGEGTGDRGHTMRVPPLD
ncbi:MAG: hypothetical protein LQ351_002480 [Letrouitia transgressa]|nr:MAG: hypothetical protein LQ351_002480 [Letrouitia transgressa]